MGHFDHWSTNICISKQLFYTSEYSVYILNLLAELLEMFLNVQ